MVLTAHLLAGAAIASKIQPAPLAILLALLSHFFLDFIPHRDYSLENSQKKKDFLHLLRGVLDISFGVLIVSFLSGGQPIIIIGALFAILPDGFSFLNMLFPQKILRGYDIFHLGKVHFLKSKKISLFWRIFSQVLIGILAIFLLLT